MPQFNISGCFHYSRGSCHLFIKYNVQGDVNTSYDRQSAMYLQSNSTFVANLTLASLISIANVNLSFQKSGPKWSDIGLAWTSDFINVRRQDDVFVHTECVMMTNFSLKFAHSKQRKRQQSQQSQLQLTLQY